MRKEKALKHVFATKLHTVSTSEALGTLAKDPTFSSLYPSFSKLAFILPVSTADCERGFSTLKKFKTPLRNRLKTETLDMLMHISLESPELKELNFYHAATVWASKTKRKMEISFLVKNYTTVFYVYVHCVSKFD